MFGRNNDPKHDLTSPENVAKGQKVYARIVTGQCKAKDVKDELDKTYGRKQR